MPSPSRKSLFGWWLPGLIILLFLASCNENPATPIPVVAVPTIAATTAAANPGTSDSQKIVAGQKVFVVHCQTCHINGGKSSGGVGPNLALSRKALDAEKVRSNVRKGADQMPAIDSTVLSDTDLENIIIYLRSIH